MLSVQRCVVPEPLRIIILAPKLLNSVKPLSNTVQTPADTIVSNPEPAPSQAPGPVEEDAMLFCPVCSLRLESRKCKLFCGRCGYYMSCADYY
jgi:hypothetical protein